MLRCTLKLVLSTILWRISNQLYTLPFSYIDKLIGYNYEIELIVCLREILVFYESYLIEYVKNIYWHQHGYIS